MLHDSRASFGMEPLAGLDCTALQGSDLCANCAGFIMSDVWR